ncbi:MAG: class I SAM-dependent methyltransferase [Candidatus Lokiarchaeota archaeon]|nr:class I SAM-dependent methyltransferase [Candidatus Lokiarchaeota archaeon]
MNKCVLQLKEEKIDIKNWVPKNYIHAFLIVESILLILSFIPFYYVLINIIFWILSGIVMFFGILCINAYYQFGKDNNALQKKIHDILLNNLPWNGEGKALDIGTGNGAVVIKLAKNYPNCKAIGIDFWGKRWEYSKLDCEKNAKIEEIGERIQFQKASAANLPFENEEFDAVVSNFVFHEVIEVKNKRELIFEALRVLKKGGAFSFQDYFYSKNYYGRKDELKSELIKSGLKEIHFKELKDSIEIPLLLRFGFFLGNMVNLYGIK